MKLLRLRFAAIVIQIAGMLLLWGSGLSGPQLASAQSAFPVNATGDAGDAAVGDGACSTGAQTPGGAAECTFRAAVEEANADADADTLRFDTLPRTRDGTGLVSLGSQLDVTQTVFIDGTTAPSHDVIAEGNLRSRVASIEQNMPGAGSEGFDVPTTNELEDWTTLIGYILDDEIQAARSVIEQRLSSYALVRFHDTVTDQPYWLLHETPTVERGWGALVVNPTPERNLAVEVPHPVFDLDTHTQGTDLFRHTGARVLVLAGTHRCANSAPSGCDGQTSVCGELGSYRVSDMAHFVDAPFQEVHQMLDQRFSGVKTLNLHGNGNSSCETVFLSDGVENTAPPLIQDLQTALSDRGVETGTPQTSTCPLEGTTNVQGRYTNGSSDPCTTPASETAGTFVHVEQRRGFREDPDEYQALIDAVNEIIPVISASSRPSALHNGSKQMSPVEGPIVGLDGDALPTGASALSIGGSEAAGSMVENITVINAPGAGIQGRTSDLTVRNCYVGLDPTGEAAPNGDEPGGSRVGGLDLDGLGFTVEGTVISGNQSVGMIALGRQGLVRDNLIGAGPDLQTVIPNAGTGSVVGGAGTSIRANVVFGNEGHGLRVEREGDIRVGYGYPEDLPDSPAFPAGQGNVIAQNDSSGVLLTTGTGTALRGNSIYGNARGGIRTTDAYEGNDDGDTDEGINRGQNVPVIEQTNGCDDGGAETMVEVQYRVRSNPDSVTASNYGADGLRVDFYGAPDGEQQGKTYLGTDRYSAAEAGESATTSLTAPDIACTDSLVATATDADGNTSQFTTPNVLPVRLAAFDGWQDGAGNVILTWTTAAEQNNARFRVEHEVGTGHWTTVGSVQGMGTTAEEKSYRFVVENLGPGAHRFRLAQVDLSGASTSHGPIVVHVRMQQALQLTTPSPNPASESITVSFGGEKSGRAVLDLYDALGQKVRRLYEGPLPAGETKRLQFNVATLASGSYFLRLRAGGQEQTRRLTVIQ